MQITEEDIGKAITGMMRSFEAEYAGMSEGDLDDRWHFEFDPNQILEVNIYRFHGMLTLYGGSCRRWEEMHNGSGCVVERVRDKYLMPKIREFADAVRSHL